MFLNLLKVMVLMVFLTGCAMLQKPEQTQVYDEGQVPNQAIKIDENTVVVDARSDFEVAMSKLENAVHLRAQDFNLENEDPATLSRRLALYGIDPDTRVLIAGPVRRGQGEDGRLAWVLSALGVKDVRVVFYDKLHRENPNRESRGKENKPVWTPAENIEKNWIKEKELKALIKKNKVFVLDVRSEAEHKGRGHISKARGMALGGARLPPVKLPIQMHGQLEWTEFYKEDGTPDPQVLAKLQSLNVTDSTSLVLVCNRGTRASAAAFALQKLGFKNTRVLSGGLYKLTSP